MEIATLTTFLKTNVHTDDKPIVGLKIYAFGSMHFSDAPTDLDLIMIFDHAVITIEEILQLRYELSKLAQTAFSLPVDICLLTEDEASHNQFLLEECAVQVYG